MKWPRVFIVSLVLATCIGINTQGQVAGLSVNEDGTVNLPPAEHVELKYKPAESIQEYLDSTWVGTQLLYPDESTRFFERARFNVLSGKLEVIINEKITDILPGIISGFSLEEQGQVLHLVLKATEPDGNNVFMECLSAGKLNLLVYRLEQRFVEDASEFFSKTFRFDPAEAEDIEYLEFFFVYPVNGETIKLKQSKKNVLNLMEDQKSIVEEYIDKERIGFGNLADLIQLFDYYNSL